MESQSGALKGIWKKGNQKSKPYCYRKKYSKLLQAPTPCTLNLNVAWDFCGLGPRWEQEKNPGSSREAPKTTLRFRVQGTRL